MKQVGAAITPGSQKKEAAFFQQAQLSGKLPKQLTFIPEKNLYEFQNQNWKKLRNLLTVKRRQQFMQQKDHQVIWMQSEIGLDQASRG